MNFFLFHQFFFSYLCIPDAEKRLLFIDLEYHRLMKKILFFLLPLCLVFIPNDTFAQTVEADSVDVLHYDLTLDMGHSVDKQLRATADITFRLTRDCRSVTFDLICDSLSPISLDGVVTRGYTYDRDNALLSVYISGGQAGDTHVVSVPYVSNGYVESYGFGGLHMDNNIYYNLGAAFSAYPHVYGRSWYPCRDNFYDKATYRYTVTAKPGWKALCSGIKQSEVSNPDGSSTSVWLLQYPIPTYISSVSSANWHVIERQYESIYGTYPAILGFTTHDSASVAATFDMLEEVIPMFERCFGPYRWERVGYISTPTRAVLPSVRRWPPRPSSAKGLLSTTTRKNSPRCSAPPISTMAVGVPPPACRNTTPTAPPPINKGLWCGIRSAAIWATPSSTTV